MARSTSAQQQAADRWGRHPLKHTAIGRACPTRAYAPTSSWWVCPPDRFSARLHCEVARFRRPLPNPGDFVVTTDLGYRRFDKPPSAYDLGLALVGDDLDEAYA